MEKHTWQSSAQLLACSLRVLAAAASAACMDAGDGCHPYLACPYSPHDGDAQQHTLCQKQLDTLSRLQGYSMYRGVMTSGNSALPEAFAPGWPSQAPRLGLQPNRRSPPLLGKGCRPGPCTIVKYSGCRILSFGSFVSQWFSHCANLTNSRCLYALLLPQFLVRHSC